MSVTVQNPSREPLIGAGGVREARQEGARPRLLVVPHIYAEDILIRDIEFARRLTHRFDVFCLKWEDALHVDAASPFRRRASQLRRGLKGMIAKRTSEKRVGGVTYLETRILQPVLLHRLAGQGLALKVARAFNTRHLAATIREHGITHVLLASALFGIPQVNGVKTFYDVVDWFPEERATKSQLALHRRHVEELAGETAGVFGVSEPLCDMLRANYGLRAVALPNGADLKVLRTVPQAEIDAVRRRWNLEGKFVIGYVGNHGSYTGVDFVLNVFRGVRLRLPDAALLIVGPAEYWKRHVESLHSEHVIFTGPVEPKHVPAYFHVLDLGVLAQEKTLGTEFAFQIKMVEYTACRKFVVSTPLRVWERLKWPNVALVPLRREDWIEAITRLRHARWNPEWDTLADPFDWQTLADQAADAMTQEG